MKTGVLSEPPLVGREPELEELSRYLDIATEGKGTTVFVSGEAGSGKTRLTREFLDAAEKKGVAVLAGWCLSDVATPYFPFVEVFNSYFSRFEDDQQLDIQSLGDPLYPTGASKAAPIFKGITAWLTGTKPAATPGRLLEITPEVWKDQIFAGVTRTLHEISVRQPVILFIEDVHWADSASLALLHYICRVTKDSDRLLVLATFRSEELAADSEGRSRPLVETLRLMKRENLYDEITLSKLGQDCIGSIAQSMLGGTLDPELAEKLSRKSNGNALFVVESLRMWREMGSLIQERNGLRLTVDDLGVPSKFKDIILRRLGSLKFNQRRVLDVASAIGEKFDADLLGFVLEKDILEVLETLDEVAQSTHLIFSEGDRFRFDHARSREILYQEISIPLKKGYHAKIAKGLESKILEKSPWNSLAYHYAQAGNIEKAVHYALKAGEDALTRFSNLEAINSFRYVLGAIEEKSEFSDVRIRALFGLADSLVHSGQSKEALKIFENMANSADSCLLRLRALRQASEVSVMLGYLAHVMDLAAAAEKYSEFDRLEFARVQNARARAISNTGRVGEARKITEEALRVFEEEGALSDIAKALTNMTVYYARMDKTPLDNGLATILRSISLYKELGNIRSSMTNLGVLGIMFLSCGLFEKAYDMYSSVIKFAEKIGGLGLMAMNYTWLGIMFEARGFLKARSGLSAASHDDIRTAISYSLKGVQAAEKTDGYGFKMLSCGNLVRQYVKLGELEQAEFSFKKLEGFVAARGVVENPWDQAQYLRSKAAFFAAKGQWAEAAENFRESLISFTNFTGVAFPMFVAETRTAYAEALARQEMIDESKEQLEKANTIIEDFVKCKEKVERTDVRANSIARREVGVDEEFEVRIDIVNVATNPVSILGLENIVPHNFTVVSLPSDTRVQNCAIVMNAKKIGPFQVEPVKLAFRTKETGVFTLNPRVIYKDHMDETRTLELAAITFTVLPLIHYKIGDEEMTVPMLPDRLSFGFKDLNVLLYGGIPERSAVIVSSSPGDERESLTRRFLEAGIKAGQPTYCITTDVALAKDFAEKNATDHFLFVCNPRAEAAMQEHPNVFRIKGVENLTDIEIALVKAFRALDAGYAGPKRAFIEIVSDVLLQHHALTTRKWLSGLLVDLKSNGFTILAAVDPNMHSPEELHAILSLFEGEIAIYEKETAMGIQKILRVKKLQRNRYIENELVLTKEMLS